MTVALKKPERVERPGRPDAVRRPRTLWASVLRAVGGLVETAANQRNMKVHLVSGLLVGLVGSGIPLGLAEKVTLIFCVILVLFAEMANTALESLVDLHTEDFRELAAKTKDVAAAGVLVLALGTVVIFAALLVHTWPVIVSNPGAVFRQSMLGVPLTVTTGLLLWSRPRPVVFDHLLFGAGIAMLAALALWTTSSVFTAMTAGLFCLARLAANRMRPGRARVPPEPRA